ncbi:MAG: TetR/AcrR family transcriptional regulator [Pirellulales bacterium]|nr:TetR/AcrR family transcriptional regulator [Pirellulales bacterium]
MAAKGYDATSVRDIVEACHVTKPTLYYYFKSKKGLAQALVTVPMTALVDALHTILADDRAGRDKLVGMVETQFVFCRENPDRARFVYALFFGPAGTEMSQELAGFGQQIAEAIEHAVLQSVAEGALDGARVERCVAAVRGAVAISTMDHLYRDRPLGPELAGQIVDDLFRGFAASVELVPDRSAGVSP